MQSQEGEEKEVMEDLPESPALAPLPVSRNKGPARCYFVMMALVYFALVLMAVVALGSFGIKQAEITRRQLDLGIDPSKTCILFAKFLGTRMEGDKTVYVIELKSPGLCGYVLWGLISITIVAVVWLVYSIVLAVIGPKIISLMRFIDLVMMVLTALLSFSLSVTLNAGLDTACSKNANHRCGSFVEEGNERELEFYDEIHTAKSSSWATTLLLIAISVWYFIAVISYFCIRKHRRQASQYAHFENSGQGLPKAV